jgi:peptidoglycan/LPS O-acetylase OafA/YrhL
MGSEEKKPSARLPAIDALRGVAVLCVLVSHLPFSLNTTRVNALSDAAFPEWVGRITDHGRFGVHLFLVLSGFCIHMAWARRKDIDATVDFGAFWRRRLHRLYPPYFVALLFAVVGLYAFHAVLGGKTTGSIALRFGYADTGQLALDLILLVFLLQNLNGSSRRIGNEPFWTLALEEQLYALYFPLLWMRRRWGWTSALIVVGATTLIWRLVASYIAPAEWTELFRVGPARWFEWALGALAVEAYLGRVKLPRWCQSGIVGVVLLAVAALTWTAPTFGISIQHVMPVTDSLFGIALFTLVNFACAVRWADPKTASVVARFFAWVGTFSYSLYLVHVPVMFATKHLALRLGFGVAGTLVMRVVLPIAAAWTFYMLVERRFLNASRQKASSGPSSSSSAPPLIVAGETARSEEVGQA